MKYLWRWKNKGGLKDLNKAKWYLEHLIATVGNDAEELKTMEDILIEKQFDVLHDED